MTLFLREATKLSSIYNYRKAAHWLQTAPAGEKCHVICAAPFAFSTLDGTYLCEGPTVSTPGCMNGCRFGTNPGSRRTRTEFHNLVPGLSSGAQGWMFAMAVVSHVLCTPPILPHVCLHPNTLRIRQSQNASLASTFILSTEVANSVGVLYSMSSTLQPNFAQNFDAELTHKSPVRTAKKSGVRSSFWLLNA